MRIEAALRGENPETPALVHRDERHIRWAEAEAQTTNAGPSPGTPVAADSGPRRGGHDDLVMTDDEDQFEFDIPVLDESDDDMSIEEQQPAAPAATGNRPAARQREPEVDEDNLPLDNAEDSASKRRRLGQLCTRSLLTEMTEILNKQAVKNMDRDVRRTQVARKGATSAAPTLMSLRSTHLPGWRPWRRSSATS